MQRTPAYSWEASSAHVYRRFSMVRLCDLALDDSNSIRRIPTPLAPEKPDNDVGSVVELVKLRKASVGVRDAWRV